MNRQQFRMPILYKERQHDWLENGMFRKYTEPDFPNFKDINDGWYSAYKNGRWNCGGVGTKIAILRAPFQYGHWWLDPLPVWKHKVETKNKYKYKQKIQIHRWWSPISSQQGKCGYSGEQVEKNCWQGCKELPTTKWSIIDWMIDFITHTLLLINREKKR